MLEFIEHNWVSIVGSLMGIIYLWLEYKANIWMWAASIAMAAFYIYIFYDTGLYASMCIYIYFFGASVYGWLMWLFRSKNEVGDDVIVRIPQGKWMTVLSAILLIWAVVYAILLLFSNNNGLITLGDSLTTSLNIVALWMVSRKWADQWLLLIPANFISSILLIVQQDIISGVMFIVFFIGSIYGFRKWKSLCGE